VRALQAVQNVRAERTAFEMNRRSNSSDGLIPNRSITRQDDVLPSSVIETISVKVDTAKAIFNETVHNVGVITPANETDAGSNFRLGMLTAEGSHGPSNRRSMDRPAGAGSGGRDEVAGHDRTGRS
jgi:hypothetical protein